MSLTQQLGRFIADGAITSAKVDPTLLASLARNNFARALQYANLAGTYNNGASGVGATLTKATNGAFPAVDGLTIAVGENVFLPNQTAPEQNGLYSLTDAGGAGAPWILTRVDSMDQSAEFAVGLAVTVGAGTVFADTVWILAAAVAVVGTDPVTFGSLGSFLSSAFKVRDTTDPTKVVAVDASGITTGTTRTVTAANRNVALDNIEQEAVEYVTLSGTDITNKYYDLAHVPKTAAKTKLAVKGSGPLFYTDDFTVITDGSVIKRLNWSTLGLDGVLIAGDKLQVCYLYD